MCRLALILFFVFLVGGWAVIVPAKTVEILSSKDSYKATLLAPHGQTYQVCLSETQRLGKKTYQDETSGIVKAIIGGANVTIKIIRREDNETEVIISARKFFFPDLNIAGGVLHEIAGKLDLNLKQ